MMASPAPRGAMEQPGGIGVASSSHVLGPDDVIEVSVLGRPEMTHQTRIKPDGTIVLPLAGTVKASNHTILTLADERSEEHTSELQSLMRISYAVFCLKKKIKKQTYQDRYKDQRRQ